MNPIDLIASAIVVVILVFIIVSLSNTNKKLKNRLEQEKIRINFYKQEFQKLNFNNPGQKDIDILDKLARDFFKEKYGLKYSLTYTQLAEEFSRNGEEEKANFCIKMSNLLFSTKEIRSEEIREVIKIFAKILEDVIIL